MNENEEKDVLESYDFTFTYEEKREQKTETITIRPWNLLVAPKCFRLIGQIMKEVRKEQPDIDLSNIMANLDILVYAAAEPVFELISLSLPRNYAEQSKVRLKENCNLEHALELLEAIVKLNFFRPNLVSKIQSLLGLLVKEENDQNPEIQ